MTSLRKRLSLFAVLALCAALFAIPAHASTPASGDADVDQFVAMLYERLLGRQEIDLEGQAYWQDLLERGKISAEDMIKSFCQSEEFEARQLDDTQYLQLLHEVLFDDVLDDEEGLDHWLQELDAEGRDAILQRLMESRMFHENLLRYGVG